MCDIQRARCPVGWRARVMCGNGISGESLLLILDVLEEGFDCCGELVILAL